MARLTKEIFKVFGLSGIVDDFAKFGSKVAGAPLKTKDLATIQSLSTWDNGLKDALYASNKVPFYEDLNALFYVLSYQTGYILQEGVIEYNDLTTYHTNSVVKKTGTTEIYVSLIDDNLGNALPIRSTDSNWKYAGSYETGISPNGIIQMWSGALANIPAGWVLCDGTAGTPNLTDKFIKGISTAITNPGTTGGANSYTLSTSQLPSHNHTINHDHGAHGHTNTVGNQSANHAHSGTTSVESVSHTHTMQHTHTYSSTSATGSVISALNGSIVGYNVSNSAHTHAISGVTSGSSVVSAGVNVGSASASHTHTFSTGNQDTSHTHTVTINSSVSISHTGNSGSAGSGSSIDNRPAFYELAFIIKVY